MAGRLLGADQAAVDHVLDLAVVAADPVQRAVAQQIGAAVAAPEDDEAAAPTSSATTVDPICLPRRVALRKISIGACGSRQRSTAQAASNDLAGRTSCSSSSTILADAQSPPSWPPMPSATTHRPISSREGGCPRSASGPCRRESWRRFRRAAAVLTPCPPATPAGPARPHPPCPPKTSSPKHSFAPNPSGLKAAHSAAAGAAGAGTGARASRRGLAAGWQAAPASRAGSGVMARLAFSPSSDPPHKAAPARSRSTMAPKLPTPGLGSSPSASAPTSSTRNERRRPAHPATARSQQAEQEPAEEQVDQCRRAARAAHHVKRGERQSAESRIATGVPKSRASTGCSQPRKKISSTAAANSTTRLPQISKPISPAGAEPRSRPPASQNSRPRRRPRARPWPHRHRASPGTSRPTPSAWSAPVSLPPISAMARSGPKIAA
jgi:hypothetical protein